MKDLLLDSIVMIIVVSVFAYAFVKFTDTPDVIFSYSTGECMKVINADGTEGSCDNLPTTYNHVWGK